MRSRSTTAGGPPASTAASVRSWTPASKSARPVARYSPDSGADPVATRALTLHLRFRAFLIRNAADPAAQHPVSALTSAVNVRQFVVGAKVQLAQAAG